MRKHIDLSGAHCLNRARCGSEEGPARAIWWVYSQEKMLARHWLSMASHCQFSSAEMQVIMDDVFDNMETVIYQVTALLPKNFPQVISDAVFAGMRRAKG